MHMSPYAMVTSRRGRKLKGSPWSSSVSGDPSNRSQISYSELRLGQTARCCYTPLQPCMAWDMTSLRLSREVTRQASLGVMRSGGHASLTCRTDKVQSVIMKEAGSMEWEIAPADNHELSAPEDSGQAPSPSSKEPGHHPRDAGVTLCSHGARMTL